MGSSSSIVISKQASLQLSRESLDEFNKYRLECEQYPNKLNSLEIYTKLTCKYEELIEKDNNSILTYSIAIDATSLEVNKADEKEHTEKEKAMFVEEIKKKIKEFEEEPQSQNQVYENKGEYFGGMLDGLFLVDKNYEKNANENKVTKDLYHCDLCSISFDSKSIFQTHFQKSYLHAKNKRLIENQRLEVQYELERLHGVAEEVADTIYSYKDTNIIDQTSISKSKMLWKKATDIVIGKQLVMKFTERLSNRIDLPWGIELIFSGSKYFHKTKQTYDLQYFLHIKYDVLEIIPHLIPFSYTKNQLIDTKIESFISCSHIFLCYSELLKSFFHYKDFNSTLTGIINKFDENVDVLKLHRSKSFNFVEHQALGCYISNNLKVHKSNRICSSCLYICLPDEMKSSIIYASIPNDDGFESFEIDKSYIKNAWMLNGVHKV